MRDSSRMRDTRRSSRCTSDRMLARNRPRATGSSAAPSHSSSAAPRMEVSGVLNSWDMLAANSETYCARASSCCTIVSNARASCPISSCRLRCRLTVRSPAAMRVAVRVNRPSGREMVAARNSVINTVSPSATPSTWTRLRRSRYIDISTGVVERVMYTTPCTRRRTITGMARNRNTRSMRAWTRVAVASCPLRAVPISGRRRIGPGSVAGRSRECRRVGGSSAPNQRETEGSGPSGTLRRWESAMMRPRRSSTRIRIRVRRAALSSAGRTSSYRGTPSASRLCSSTVRSSCATCNMSRSSASRPSRSKVRAQPIPTAGTSTATRLITSRRVRIRTSWRHTARSARSHLARFAPHSGEASPLRARITLHAPGIPDRAPSRSGRGRGVETWPGCAARGCRWCAP